MPISLRIRPIKARLAGAGVALIAAFAGKWFAVPATAQTIGERPKVMIVLDASGSMRAQMQGRTRMDIAKDTLSTVLSEIPPEVDIGLIAYGHRERGSCTDIETIVGVGPARQTVPQILSRGRALRPLGKTPLTQAVRLAAEELKYTEDKATVILITDGIETCEADPCALGRELARDGVGFTAHVVGFGMTQHEGRQVACLAENTGGKYVPANNADELTDALRDLVNVEPEPEPEPVIQARPVHFTWRDTAGGPHLNSRAFQMVIRPLDDGDAPENIRLWHHERPYSAEANMMPGRYVALVQRAAAGNRTINARIEFTVEPGNDPFIVDRVIAARLRLDGVLTANGDVKRGNLHVAPGGSDPRFDFTLYPIENGAVNVGGRISLVNSQEIALGAGRYLVHATAPGFRREKLVDVKAGETIVMRFDFDLAEVFIELDDRDGFPRKRPLDLIYETMEGTSWSHLKHIDSGRGRRNNRAAPYLLPKGLWRIKAYDEGSPRPSAETIIEVTSSAQPIRLKLQDGQSPDPQIIARFTDPNRVGCIQRLSGHSACLVEAIRPDQIDSFTGINRSAAEVDAALGSFEGTWFTTEGVIALQRDGRRVVGEWQSSTLNHVEARLSGDLRTLRGTWFSENTKAHGLFEARLSEDGATFAGNWSRGDRPPSGSGWNGRRISFGAPELRENPKEQSRFPEQLSTSARFQKFISEVESQPDQVAPRPSPEQRGEVSPPSAGATTVAVAGEAFNLTHRMDFTNDRTGQPALSIIFDYRERQQRAIVVMKDGWCGGGDCPAQDMPIVGHPYPFWVMTKGGATVVAQTPNGGSYLAIESKDLFADRSVPPDTIKLSIGTTEVNADLRPVKEKTREIATFTGRLIERPTLDGLTVRSATVSTPDGRSSASPAGARGETKEVRLQQPAGGNSGWLNPRPPPVPEPPGMSCEDLRNKVAEIMTSTNIARQQQVIGIGEREGFAGGPPSAAADCARLARAFTAGGVPGFEFSTPGRRSDATPPPAPAVQPPPQPQPERRAEPTPPEPPVQRPLQATTDQPGRRDTILGSWGLERTGFRAELTVKRHDGPPPIGSYQPFDVEMRVESRRGDGCPKEPAWQAICRNVHQYGSYKGVGQVSAGAVVPGNDRRNLRGQLVGDVMLPIQISLDPRGWLWVSLPKGEAWGEEPSRPAGWYNLRFNAIGDTSPDTSAAASPQQSQDMTRTTTAPAFPGTTIWAIIDNEMNIGQVSDAERLALCRRDPRVGFGDGVMVHRRENPNWRPGQRPSPGNPGTFITVSVRECDRSGDRLECLEKPVSPVNGQPLADAARILQFRLEAHAQSGGVRICPVNSGHMTGGRQCGIALPCTDAEMNIDAGGQNLLAAVTAPVPGYPARTVTSRPTPATSAATDETAKHNATPPKATGSAGEWGCQLVFGHMSELQKRTRSDDAFGKRLVSVLNTSGLMSTLRGWGERPPVDPQLCRDVAAALAKGGIEPFTRADAPTLATCDDFRAIADHLPKYRDLPGFEMTDAQSAAAFGLIRSDWGSNNPTDAQCRAMAYKWRDLSIPGFTHQLALSTRAAAPTASERKQPSEERGGTVAGGTWSCLYVNGQIKVVNDAALRSGPTRNETLFEGVMRTLRTGGFMRADQGWGANPPTDRATCDRLGEAMRKASIPGFDRPNPGTITSCTDLRAIGKAVQLYWDKFGITPDQRRRALDLPASLDSLEWTEPQCRAVGEHWASLGLPGISKGNGSQAPPPTPAPQRRGDTGTDQRQPPPNRQADATNARAVKIVENLYGEHIRRSKLGGSVLEHVEMATGWGFARSVATVLVRNLERIGSDPIFDAQDFDITQLNVTLDPKPATAGRIAVLAKFRNFGKPTQLRYILQDTGQGPEIVDIEGSNWRLRRLLRLDR